MEGNLLHDSSSLPVLADLAVTQGCDNELSRSESESESGSEMDSSSTVENSKASLHQIGDSAKDYLTAWTNEKHNLYLDHLESSFVEQLQQSPGILAWCSEHSPNGPYLSQKLHAKQLKVVRDGCSDNIDLKRSQHILNHATGSLFVLKSHPRCAGRGFLRAAKLQDKGAARNLCTGDEKIFFNKAGMSSQQISTRNEKLLDYIGEFSDQNFADEASEQTSKRSKTTVPEISGNNQLVHVDRSRVRL